MTATMAIKTSEHERFCANMRARRLQLGMSQGRLAELLGKHTPNISNMEKGIHSPNLSTMVAVANALDIDLKTLLFGQVAVPEKISA